VRLHERFEERGFRPEDSEECDFINAGFDGDESRGGATEAVLGVDAFCGVEDAIADVTERLHGFGPRCK
jgi:hypothetical protein